MASIAGLSVAAAAQVSRKYAPGLAARWLVGIGLMVGCHTMASAQDGPVVRRLRFEGNHSLTSIQLAAAIATTKSSWFATAPIIRWIGLGEKRRFNDQEFRVDVERLRLFYRLNGFLEVAVDTLVERSADDVFITFRISEGQPVRVAALEITGLDSVSDRGQILKDLPLKTGEPLVRMLITATADTISERLRNRGYPTAVVFLTRRDVDSARREANVSLRVAPGVPAVVGGITVVGTEKLDTAFVRTLMATEAGRTYRFRDLARSQRSLYRTDLFRFVNVGIDTTQFREGEPLVPLLVEVNEGRFHRARGSIGYGTTDCFRGTAGWTSRNFFGNGRALDLSGSISKLGVGDPFDWGFRDNALCPQLTSDTIGSRRVNYNITATLRRPNFLSPENQVSMAIFSERRSEYRTFQREDLGGSVTLTRESTRQLLMGLTYQLTYGGTEASDASFCAFFNACTRNDIVRLREKRLLGLLTGSISRQRVNNILDPTTGSVATLEVAWSARAIGSAAFTEFTRFLAEGAIYRELTEGVVFAARLRGGAVVAPEVALGEEARNFIPPEQRFYAGGADDVRGFVRNELGPVVYVIAGDRVIDDQFSEDAVRVVPIGGNTLVLGNMELRFPSPVFGRQFRLAAFADAGSLWERGRPGSSPLDVRVTPGMGVRVASPLGPVRVDVAYNPYDLERGTLFKTTADGGLEILRENFRRADRERGRFTFHFSVGHPF